MNSPNPNPNLSLRCMFILIGLCFCKAPENPEVFEVVELSNQDPELSFFDFFESVELTELKFKGDSNWVGNISSYVLTDEHIFLSDEFQGQKIVKFSLSGEFLGEIGSVGDAPGGFNRPSLLAVNGTKSRLLVFDRSLLRLVEFDLDLNYQKSEQLEEYYSNISFVPASDDLLMCTEEIKEEQEGYVIAYKRSGEKFESVLHTQHKIVPHLSEAYFYNANSGIYHLPFEEKLYQYDQKSGQFIPKYQIQLNSEDLPEELLNSTDIAELNEYLFQNELRAASFNGTEHKGRFYFFYHDTFESFGLAAFDVGQPKVNLNASWEKLIGGTNIPVPNQSGSGYYCSVGYLSGENYEAVSQLFGLNAPMPTFSEYRENLFLFKFKLK